MGKKAKKAGRKGRAFIRNRAKKGQDSIVKKVKKVL